MKEEKQVFLLHIENFNQYQNILSIFRLKTGYLIKYTNTPSEKNPVKWTFKWLNLDLKNQKYYYENGNTYNSLEDALQTIGFNQAEFVYWREFLEKYNLYSISTGMNYDFVEVTINRFHIVPHGLLYVFPEDDDGMNSILTEIPGRLRGKKTAVYDILTHIEGRWFYFEGS